jgi:hypothetical protein
MPLVGKEKVAAIGGAVSGTLWVGNPSAAVGEAGGGEDVIMLREEGWRRSGPAAGCSVRRGGATRGGRRRGTLGGRGGAL